MAYDAPTAADLKMRYPAFAAMDDATVQYWLTDSQRFVDTSWLEGDYAPALMAMAAHSMFEGGVISDAASSAAAAGLTTWKSGSATLQFSDTAAALAAEGGLNADKYGREYLSLLMRNKAGPRVTSPGHVPCGHSYRDGPFSCG